MRIERLSVVRFHEHVRLNLLSKALDVAAMCPRFQAELLANHIRETRCPLVSRVQLYHGLDRGFVY